MTIYYDSNSKIPTVMCRGNFTLDVAKSHIIGFKFLLIGKNSDLVL